MEIRDYKEGDEIQILSLFETVFGKPMKPSYWKWRFNDNPSGKHLIKLMWDKDQLIGHYAVSPHFIMIGGSKHLATLSMATMTHPDYTGLGIFGGLANALYEKLEIQLNVKAIWGFPNNNSHSGFIKNLKWIDLGQISHLSLKAVKIDPVSNDSINPFITFTNEHASLMSVITSQFKVYGLRDAAYLNWRYVENPTSSYDKFEFRENGILTGFIVVKRYPSSTNPGVHDLYITEIGISKERASLLKLFLSHIAAYYSNSEATINTWISLFDNRYPIFEKAGFQPGGKPTYVAVRPNNEMADDLSNFKNWYLSYGDSDVY